MTPAELRFFERYLRWLVAGTESAGSTTAEALLGSSLSFEHLPQPWPDDLDQEVAETVHRANVAALVE